jgi:sigma-E factor negative regulatory protein RseA
VVALPAAASQPLVEAAGDSPVVVANPTIIRDARLDRYLSAHQQFAGSSALGQPSRYLRSATVEAPAR